MTSTPGLSLLLVVSTPAVGGAASYSLPVPNAPEQAGATLSFQGGAVPVSPLGVLLSNGGTRRRLPTLTKPIASRSGPCSAR